MAKTRYVWCSCESFGCRSNPDGSGQRAQTAQTAVRHQRADEQLAAARARAVPQANQADLLGHPDLPVLEQQIPPFLDHPVSRGASESPVRDPRPLPHAQEPEEHFDHWGDIPQGPDDFNSGDSDFSPDEDDEVFRRLGLRIDEEEVDGDPGLEDDVPAAEEEPPLDNPEEQDQMYMNDLLAPLGANFDYSDTQDDVDIHTKPPPCMQDHPAIRNAYIRAYISASFFNATHVAVSHDLEGKECLLRTTQSANPDIEYPGLDRFARTLPTLLKRLGLTTDNFIVYLFVCNVCWKLHHPSQLNDLETSHCNTEDCPGLLYTQKQLADGSSKRTPTKILPYVPPERALQRIFLRPGKWDQFQHWRRPGDDPMAVPPIPGRGFDSFPDPDKPLTDLYDGWGWRAIQAGLQRRRGGPWEVEDADVFELHQRFVSLPCGLVWQMNIDWYAYL